MSPLPSSSSFANQMRRRVVKNETKQRSCKEEKEKRKEEKEATVHKDGGSVKLIHFGDAITEVSTT